MRILFLIGNGFDLNIGLKTRYSDFYNYYQKVQTKSKTISDLKSNISLNINNWSDLELALGEYTENLKNVKEFDEMFENIGMELSNYLQGEEKKIDYSIFDTKKMPEYLTFPERSLLPADKNKVNTFKSKWNSNNWLIDIITFNYTMSLEKILGTKKTFNLTQEQILLL